MSWPVPISAAALPAWRRLADVLDEVGPVACQGIHADLWTSEDPDEREGATYRCVGCPALDACGAFADLARERFGVWAGKDKTKGPAQRQPSHRHWSNRHDRARERQTLSRGSSPTATGYQISRSWTPPAPGSR